MTFFESLAYVEDVPPAYAVACEHCRRPSPVAATKQDAMIAALKDGWLLKLPPTVSLEAGEFVSLDVLLDAFDTREMFCPGCARAEFLT